MSYHFLLIFSTFYSKNFYTLFPTLSIVLLSTNFFNILPFLGIFLGMFSGTLSKNRFHLFLYLVLKLKNRFIKVFKSLINLWCQRSSYLQLFWLSWRLIQISINLLKYIIIFINCNSKSLIIQYSNFVQNNS